MKIESHNNEMKFTSQAIVERNPIQVLEVIQVVLHSMWQIVEEDVHVQLEYFAACLFALTLNDDLKRKINQLLLTPSIRYKYR